MVSREDSFEIFKRFGNEPS